MRDGIVLTRAYRFCPKSDIWELQWVPEDAVIGEYSYSYDETAPIVDMAKTLAAAVVNKLASEYSRIGYNPNPRAVIIYGDDVIGAEVYYYGLSDIMKISARMNLFR